VPRRIILAIVFALLYVLNPVDMIPDAIPVVGYVDERGGGRIRPVAFSKIPSE